MGDWLRLLGKSEGRTVWATLVCALGRLFNIFSNGSRVNGGGLFTNRRHGGGCWCSWWGGLFHRWWCRL
ncbi:MAG: hypothetical protein ACTS41_00910 [Candidatus Hodgkinia cicadicola]